VRPFIGAVLLLCITFTAWSAASAAPDFGSGNFMLPHCEHYIREDYSYDVWDGDCGGTIDTFLFLREHLPEGFRVCQPKGVTSRQAGRVVVEYMRGNPSELHYPFRVLAMTALSRAWPCK
jgi:hypothetical protein